MDKKLVKTSKFLSLILRHRPGKIGLSLDEFGWVSIRDLLAAAKEHGHNMSRELLDEVVFTNDKKRFSYSADGRRIRANQGHSVKVDLSLKPVVPPPILYHGTVEKFLKAIKVSGLQKMKRRHVHLSATVDTAKSVGARRGKPIVLSIDAGKMHQDGFEFFLSANGVWLTDSVPWKFITNRFSSAL